MKNDQYLRNLVDINYANKQLKKAMAHRNVNKASQILAGIYEYKGVTPPIITAKELSKRIKESIREPKGPSNATNDAIKFAVVNYIKDRTLDPITRNPDTKYWYINMLHNTYDASLSSAKPMSIRTIRSLLQELKMGHKIL